MSGWESRYASRDMKSKMLNFCRPAFWVIPSLVVNDSAFAFKKPG